MSKTKAGATTLDSLDEPTSQAYENLRVKLNTAKTVSALYKIVDADFKAEVARLPEVAQRALRDGFAVLLDELRGKVMVEDIADVALTIASPPDFLEPKEFKQDDGSKKMTQSIVVRGVRDDSGEKIEFITGAVRIVRHFEKATLYPQHVTIYAESPEQQRARGAGAGQKPMWLVRRMPAPSESRGVVPF